MTREEVNDILSGVLDSQLHDVWWDLRLPAFGGHTANELLANGRGDEVLDHVKKYTGPMSS